MLSYSYFYLFYLMICLVPLIAADGERNCFNQSEDKYVAASLPEEFNVYIEFTDRKRNFTADMTEYFDRNSNLSSLEVDKYGRMYKLILNRTSNMLTFINNFGPEPICNVSTLSIDTWPRDSFYFPSDKNRTVTGLVDLFDLFSKSESLEIDRSTREYGRTVQHIMGCSKTPEGKSWLEFKVRMTDRNFSINNVQKSHSVPTRVEVRIYENKNVPNLSFDFNGVYEISGYKVTTSNEKEEAYQQPPGVHCNGSPKTVLPSELPNDFSVLIEHVDHTSKLIDSDELYYDSDNKIIGMEFSRTSDDEPGTIGIVDQLAPGHYRLIQDFKSGYQYLVDSITSRCIQNGPFSGQAGSTKIVSRGGQTLIGMKTPFQLLFTLSIANYTYVGKRVINDQSLDVWQAFEEKRNKDVQGKELIERITYELLASKETWTYNGFRSPAANMPVYFKIYKSDNYGRKNLTTQRFHNFVIYNESKYPEWPKLDVFACHDFQIMTNFFEVQMTGSLSSVNKVGMSLVYKRLRETIAQFANISILRVGEIHVWSQDDTQQVVNVSFVIANKPKQSGSKTEFYQTEIDAQAAIVKLNNSILANDLKFDVVSPNGSTTTFALRKATLIRRIFLESSIVVNVKKGYAGGSVATLSFCMLFIGVVFGVFLAYVYLKRTRGGIAYQIYE